MCTLQSFKARLTKLQGSIYKASMCTLQSFKAQLTKVHCALYKASRLIGKWKHWKRVRLVFLDPFTISLTFKPLHLFFLKQMSWRNDTPGKRYEQNMLVAFFPARTYYFPTDSRKSIVCFLGGVFHSFELNNTPNCAHTKLHTHTCSSHRNTHNCAVLDCMCNVHSGL